MGQRIKNFKRRWKGFWLTVYLRMKGCKVGKGLKCAEWPHFSYVPDGNIEIGDYADLGRWNTLEVAPAGKLILKDHVLLGHYVWITCSNEIVIGKYSAIAESASLRDGFHQLAKEPYYRKQPNNSAPIHIGDDCGIGAGTRVLQGCNIPDGVFIGANSLVLASNELEPYKVYGGNPLKLIKERK